MSSYKVIDSTISLLYCGRCANEFLEATPEGRIICTDCGMTMTIDPSMVRVGQIQGTKYKMRDNKRYSFRELVDTGRESAFSDVFVPSPEPGRKPIGWKDQLREEDQDTVGDADAADKPKAENGTIHVAGVDDAPPQGWRNDSIIDIISDEAEPDTNGSTNGSSGGSSNESTNGAEK